MGGRDFDVEPADLRGAAPSFGAAGSALEKALHELRSTLDGLGDYLGSDEQGQKFKESYEPKVREAGHAVETISTGLKRIEPALVANAEQYERDDAGVSDGMDRQVR